VPLELIPRSEGDSTGLAHRVQLDPLPPFTRLRVPTIFLERTPASHAHQFAFPCHRERDFLSCAIDFAEVGIDVLAREAR